MTGSYFARAEADISGVVAMTCDYRGCYLLRPAGCAEILFQGHVEVHQLVALGVEHAVQIKVRARQRCRDARDIEEHESALRAVGLDGAGSKLRVLNLVLRISGN